MKPTPIFISHLGLQHTQKQKNSKKLGYIDCLYYNRMTLRQVLHENLHMTKVRAQVVSKLLTSDQKEKLQEIYSDILKQIEENSKFLDSVITVSAMRDEFSSTTQRQRGSPCIGKLQTDHELSKQNQNSRQC